MQTHAWTRASEIWSLGATVYTMMTGIPPPPPRSCDYDWQICRMNDRGFSKGIRDVVAEMLSLNPGDRMGAMELVERVEEGWEVWKREEGL